jgi:cytochrome P450
MVATIGHDHHRYRRNILGGFFSKRSVNELSPVIEEKVLKLMKRFTTAYREKSTMRLDDAFAALASDVITQYAYGKSWDFLEDDDFRSDIRSAITETANAVHINRFFPMRARLLRMVPKWLVCKIQPGKASLFEFLRSIFEFTLQSMQVTKSSAEEKQETKRGTIYEKLTDPVLPPEERTLARIHDESVVILQAGTESIGRSLSICAFHLAHQPSMWKKLREELQPILPTTTSTATWAQLEQLPYLVCIVFNREINMTTATDFPRLVLFTSHSVFPTD